jgi:hypothetical protein
LSARVTSNPPPRLDQIVASTKDWQDWQRTDLARLKKLRPGQSNVVFVELQKKRPQPAATTAGDAVVAN